METVQGVVREAEAGSEITRGKNMQFAVTTVVAVFVMATAVSPSSAAAGQLDSAMSKRSDGRSD